MNTIELNCRNCNVTFKKNIYYYRQSLKRRYTNFFCSIKCSSNFAGDVLREKGKMLKIDLERSYLNNPKKCPHCEKIISYKKRYNEYCSKKCSAIYTQKYKGHCEWSLEDRKKISIRVKDYHIKNPRTKKLKTKICKNCNVEIKEKYKRICNCCTEKYYKFYRPLCEFDFVLENYPDKFDLSLIKKYGKYSPKNKGNNLTGISRDHLYSVKDGFKNKISPDIIKHPANCRLVIHKENQTKYNKSSISLDELKKRILEW